MSTIEIEVYKAFRETGLDEGKAMEAALAFASRDATIEKALHEIKEATAKSNDDHNERFGKIDERFAKVDADLLLLKWQCGFLLGLLLLVLGKLYIH